MLLYFCAINFKSEMRNIAIPLSPGSHWKAVNFTVSEIISIVWFNFVSTKTTFRCCTPSCCSEFLEQHSRFNLCLYSR